LVKRVSLIASFGAVLFVFLAIIEAHAVSDGPISDVSPFGASQYGEAPQHGPADSPVEGQIMMASYYGYSHAGNPTASGELFDPQGYTAAHRTMPFGTQLLVSHGGSSVVVAVNDRGPYVDGIDIDVSQAAAETIGLTGPGVAPVEVTVL
jgi:rare lipoprotein A (peptidoglycan hydrolase)